MAILISGINIAFSLFFFVFGRMTEAIIFLLLTIASILYFSRIIHTLQQWKQEKWKNDHEKRQIHTSISFTSIAAIIKKGSFYIGFGFLYVSLYGIFYGVNSLYGDMDPFILLKVIILGISLIIGVVYARFFKKNNPFIGLIFRSHFLVVSFFSCVLLWWLFAAGITTEFGWILLINCILSLVGIFCILVFDRDFSYPQGLFSFWLMYIISIAFVYAIWFVPSLDQWTLLFVLLLIASVIYFEGIIKIRPLRAYTLRSKQLGIILGYIGLIGLCVYVLFVPSVWLWGVLIGALIFQYTVHHRFRNYLSYILTLLISVVSYVYWWLPVWEASFFFHLLFGFGFPIIAITLTAFISMRHELDANILHYIAIAFCVAACGRYVFLTIHSFDILRWSILLFFLSGLLFSSYIVLKK